MIAIATLSTAMLAAVVPSAFAQAPTAPNSPVPTRIVPTSGPMQFQEVDTPDGPMTVTTSPNWSGYMVTGSSFTKVLGSWIVPTYHCIKTPNTGSISAVAMDGSSTTSTTFESIGTGSNCVGNHFQYYAFYELYPTASGRISNFPVKSGDVISAEITYSGSQFTVTISNITQGTFFSKSAVVPRAPRSSAEWIVTRTNGFTYLMDFGKVSAGIDYTSIADTDWATDSSVTGPIRDFGGRVVKINMMSSANLVEATPTALTTDGSSFVVNWNHE